MRSIMLSAIILGLTGCAGGPQRSRPQGMPYPTTLKPGMRVYPMEKVRCLGGGIGGCSTLDNIRH